MRKLLWVILALLSLSVMPALAQDEADLADLAAYLPAETQFYMALRSDDATIASVDGILELLAERDASLLPPGVSLSAALDDMASNIVPGADFDGLLRPWLGDTIALALLDASVVFGGSSDGNQEIVLLLSVSNREAAAEFLADTLVETSQYTLQELEEVSLYTATGVSNTDPGNGDIALWDDAIVISAGLTVAARPASTLADNESFVTGMAALPAPVYGGAIYLDVQAAMGGLFAQFSAMLESEGIPGELVGTDVFAELGPQVIGLALLDNRSLALDLVQLGLSTTDISSIDADFLANVPADAALVLQSVNFGPTLLEQLELIRVIGDLADERLEAEGVTLDDEEAGFYIINDLVAFVELSYQGLSGQSLADAVGWMTGNYAAYQRFPIEGDAILWDMGLFVENTDADAANATLAGLANLLDSTAVRYSSIDTGVIITGLQRVFAALNPNIDDSAYEGLQLFIGAEDDRFVFATTGGLNAVREGSSLTSDSTFSAAAAHFLAESSHLAYLAGRPLFDYSITLASQLDSSDAKDLARIFNLLESASISSSFGDASQTMRFVLTLAGS